MTAVRKGTQINVKLEESIRNWGHISKSLCPENKLSTSRQGPMADHMKVHKAQLAAA